MPNQKTRARRKEKQTEEPGFAETPRLGDDDKGPETTPRTTTPVPNKEDGAAKSTSSQKTNASSASPRPQPADDEPKTTIDSDDTKEAESQSQTTPLVEPSLTNGARPPVATNKAKRHRGKCRWYLAEKKYGFIQPMNGGKDIFVHHMDLASPVAEGDDVEFELGEHNGRPKAIAVVKLPTSAASPDAKKRDHRASLAASSRSDAKDGVSHHTEAAASSAKDDNGAIVVKGDGQRREPRQRAAANNYAPPPASKKKIASSSRLRTDATMAEVARRAMARDAPTPKEPPEGNPLAGVSEGVSEEKNGEPVPPEPEPEPRREDDDDDDDKGGASDGEKATLKEEGDEADPKKRAVKRCLDDAQNLDPTLFPYVLSAAPAALNAVKSLITDRKHSVHARTRAPGGRVLTLLGWACHADRAADTVRLLLAHGAAVDAGCDGTRPLGIACAPSREGVLRVSSGGTGRRRNRHLRSADEEDAPPAPRVVDALLRAGADANEPFATSANTPLLTCCLNSWSRSSACVRVASLLLDAGADVDAGNADTGETPLHAAVAMAARRGQLQPDDLVSVLLARGADARRVDSRGRLASFYVCSGSPLLSEAASSSSSSSSSREDDDDDSEEPEDGWLVLDHHALHSVSVAEALLSSETCLAWPQPPESVLVCAAEGRADLLSLLLGKRKKNDDALRVLGSSASSASESALAAACRGGHRVSALVVLDAILRDGTDRRRADDDDVPAWLLTHVLDFLVS